MGTALSELVAQAAYGKTSWKQACRTVATSNVTASGLQTISGVALAAGDRVLLTGQTSGAQNGAWVAANGAWYRATDFDTSSDVQYGSLFLITDGDYAGSTWRMTAPTSGTITLGATALTFDIASIAASASDVLVPASGDTTGATDRTAIQAVSTAGGTAILQSAETYYDDGTALTWHADARVRTTDDRPAIIEKGSSATSMTALPGCITRTSATLTMRLPPASRWPEQTIVCECTGAGVITVDPDGSEEMDQQSTFALSTSGSRLVLRSDGASPIRIVSTGNPDADSLYVAQLRGTQRAGSHGEIELRPSPRDGDGARELSGVTLIVGDLIPASGYKGGYLVAKDIDGNFIFDWQIFGSGSPTGFLYWREAYNNVGWRVQMLSSAAGEGFLLEAGNGADIQFQLGGAGSMWTLSNGSVFLQEANVDGDQYLRCVTGRTLTLGPGAGSTLDTDWGTATSAGAEQRRHATTTTGTATPAQVTLFTPTDNRTISVKSTVIAYGTSACAVYDVRAAFKRVSGTLTAVGSPIVTAIGEETGAMNATLLPSGTTVVAEVTGIAGTVRWEIYTEIMYGQA